MRSGIWVYNGFFRLIDAWRQEVNNRRVFKFKLELVDEMISDSQKLLSSLDHLRIIPTSVKLSVWRRDKGACMMCGSKDNLHFDRIIPYSKGGSSLLSENIQLLCARHNIGKRDGIE